MDGEKVSGDACEVSGVTENFSGETREVFGERQNVMGGTEALSGGTLWGLGRGALQDVARLCQIMRFGFSPKCGAYAALLSWPAD